MKYLLDNWPAVALSVLVAVTSVWLGITRIQLANTRADFATFRAGVAMLAVAAESKARKQDADNEQLARDLNAARKKADEDMAAGRADFERKLADVVRARRAACRRDVPSAPGDTGTPAPVATGGDGPDPGNAAGVRIRDLVMALQADVKQCVLYANKTGR